MKKTLFGWINALLNSGDRVTRMDFRSFAKDFSYLSINQIIGVSTAILLALAYSHLLPKDVYGTYKYILSVFGILTIFSLPGMDSSAQKWIAEGNEGVFWPTFRKRVQGSVVGVFVGLCVGAYYLLQGNEILGYSFLLSAPLLLMLEPFSHFSTLLVGRQQFKTFSFYNAGLQLVTALLILCTVLLTDNVILIILSYFASFVIARGIVFWIIITQHPPQGKSSDEALRHGAHFSFLNMLGVGSGQLDAILLFHFFGPTHLALFAFAQAASDQGKKLFKVVTSAMAFPKFSALSKERLQKELPHKILVAHYASVPLALCLVLIIPPFYQTLFPQYVASIPYAQVMAAFLAFSPVRMITTAINAKGSIRDIYTINLFASILQIVMLLILVPLFGIWGAVLTTPVQSFLSNIIFVRVFKRM